MKPPWQPSLPSFFKRKKIVPQQDKEEARNLSASFSEHTWDLETIIEDYPESRIDRKNIQRSLGLTTSHAHNELVRDGPNILPKPQEISDLRLFLSQFLNLLWILLLATDILSLVAFIADPTNITQFWVTLIIFVMIFCMCCVSFFHEREARRVVRAFQNLLPESCICIRDGRELRMSVEELVVGDIIWIKNGTRVPADARLIVSFLF